jgi:hypothetical protein
MKKSLFNPVDFISWVTQLSVRNLTTNTIITEHGPVVRGSVMNDTASIKCPIEMSEMGPQKLLLTVPRYSGAEGHVLLLQLMVYSGQQQILDIEFQGKVNRLEKLPEGSEQLEVQIDAATLPIWQQYLNLLSSRQQEINLFLEQAKG